MIYEHELKHGTRVRWCGCVDGQQDIPAVGAEGRVVVLERKDAIDVDGDVKVVFDDPKLNDLNGDYEPGSDESWLYHPAESLELAAPLDLSTPEKVEEFLR